MTSLLEHKPSTPVQAEQQDLATNTGREISPLCKAILLRIAGLESQLWRAKQDLRKSLSKELKEIGELRSIQQDLEALKEIAATDVGFVNDALADIDTRLAAIDERMTFIESTADEKLRNIQARLEELIHAILDNPTIYTELYADECSGVSNTRAEDTATLETAAA